MWQVSSFDFEFRFFLMNQPTDSPPQAAPPAPKKAPRFTLLIATGFGLGYLPKAPGTWGSLGGVATVVFARSWILLALMALANRHAESETFSQFWSNPRLYLHVALGVGTAIVGIWAAGRAARHLAAKDPQCIVIDEISGQQIALLPMSWAGAQSAFFFDSVHGWQYLLVGFILFRLFDIWKPWPARQAEKLPGGWGIMADDWVAGIYAALGLWAARAMGL